jgi:hypothetical protein
MTHDTHPAIRWLHEARKISLGTITRCLDSGWIKPATYQGKPAIAAIYRPIDGDPQTPTATQYMGPDLTGKPNKSGTHPSKDVYWCTGDPSLAGRLIVVEGVIDAMTIMDTMPGCIGVALGSTSYFKKCKNLKPYQDQIIVCMDNDDAGRAATSKIIEAIGGPVRVVQWSDDDPQGADLNDLLQAGRADRIRELIQGAKLMVGPEWPDMIPMGAPDPDRIPIDMWPSVLRDYATGAAAETETPRELPAMLALGVLSTVVQRFADVEIRPGYIEPTNVYTAIALPPATRKSQEFKRATLPLVRWEADQRLAADGQKKAAESKLATYRERIKKLRARAAKAKDDQEAGELADQIAEIETQEPPIPKAPRLFTSDITTEHLATIMVDNNESLGVLSPEGGIFETMAGRYANNIPNIDLYLKAHAADFVRVDRGSKPPVIMDEPRLTMALAIQPDVLEALSNKPTFKGRGLVGRILYVMPPSMLGSRTGYGHRISDFDFRRYSDLITSMADTTLAGNKPCKIYLSAQARHVWTAYWQEIEPGLAEGGLYAHCTDWFGKAPGAAARIAALFHVAVHGPDALKYEVSADHMTAAVATVKALGTHALKVYGQMGAIPGADLAKVLLEWIKRHGHREFSARDAHINHRSRFQTADELDLPLSILVEYGYIRPLPPIPGPGRPSKRYEINPLVWG